MYFIYILSILLFSKLEAVPVNPDTTYPKISVTDTADYYRVSITDLEEDPLYDMAYAWGIRPSVYAFVSVAADDTVNWYFSQSESLRWGEIQRKSISRWDQATYNKHPLDFVFLKKPLIINLNKQTLIQNDLGLLTIYSELEFEEQNYITLKTPYIYICIDGGQYFNDVGQSSGSDGDQRLSSIYIGMFKKGSEVIDAVIVHELCHPFVYLPNISPWFDATSHYIQIGDNDVEKYDPLSLTEPPLDSFYCASLSQMCLGIRSKYEDAGLWTYNIHTGDSSYIDTVSSKYFYEQRDEGTVYSLMKRYWNLHWNSPKISLPDSTRDFLVPKSEQDNRSLLVFASDSLHPGYFKCFSLGAQSEVTVIENEVPDAIYSYTRHGEAGISGLRVFPNPFRREAGIHFTINGNTVTAGGRAKVAVLIYDSNGSRIRDVLNDRLPPGEYRVVWDGLCDNGNQAPYGVYFYVVTTGDKKQTGKMFLIR